jgi:superfamily I DNA/RNA helicase
MGAAYALVSELEFEEFDDEAKTRTVPPELSSRIGEKPIICKCSDLDGEVRWVAEAINDLHKRLSVYLPDMAVLYRGSQYKSAIDHALQSRGVNLVFHVEDDFLSSEDAVRVSTIHSTKGMEFKVVLIVGLT